MSSITRLLACGVASVFFGSMFVPIKRYNAGDGIYVQWLMSVSIVTFAFFTWLWEGIPQFYPLAMVGGMLWCLGNATAVPIIRRLGMAMGMLIWNTTNCLAGWAGGNFGLFGMTARPAANKVLNYIGLLFVIVGFVFYLSYFCQYNYINKMYVTKVFKKDCRCDKYLPYIGIILALGAGAFYGSTFVPVIYIQDNIKGASQRGTPYVFAHSMGIFLTATALFIGYSIINKPVINNQITLPALCAGLIWIIAQTSFFVANENLSQTVSFPIITMIPGCVASAWSIFVFKEIRGARNLRLLGIAIVITLCGALMVGLSKALTF
uniref:Transmembrane protein 144 n=1 Tax=Syphacia muris TaxID=451379 RepID=A0A0N5AIC3_9BILA